MKIKIRISQCGIIAIPITKSIIPPPPRPKNLPRGRHGLPKSAAPRIRSAVNEIGEGIFSTIFFDVCPTAEIINRIRTHFKCPIVGVIEYGVKNGWHIHLVHNVPESIADRILSNYSEKRHHRKIDNIKSTAWYLTKSVGDKLPDGDLPNHWYFCSRDLGRDEIFYVDSTIVELKTICNWEEREYYFIALNTLTTVHSLKNLPRYPK